MALWTNEGRANAVNYWADIVQNVRLRMASAAVAVKTDFEPYVDEEDRWAA